MADENIMPNIRTLIESGSFDKMASSVPEISSVAWSSIITGKNPAEHGIFGFMDLRPYTYQMHFPNFNDLKALPFWLCDFKDDTSVIINVPATYPVKQMKGVHISGFISLKFEESIYPQSLVSKLDELNYKIDVDASLAHKSLELFLEDLDKTLKSRIRAYRYLWNEYDWDNFMLVFTGTDRLGHFMWDALDDKGHKYHNEFLDHFRQIDEAVGEIRENLNSNDTLVLLSDHGFEKLDYNVNVNFLLKDKGLLRFKKGQDEKIDNISKETKAFALDPARIYINLLGRYPQGGVEDNDKEGVMRELIEVFDSLEKDGRKVIRDIYKKEDIYHGPYMDKAPDLVLVAEKGFNLKAIASAQSLYEENIFKGKHSQDNAFFLSNKKTDGLLNKSLSVYNVLEVIKKLKAA
jgi:predicted AlkP superfamily phosphohydrolase/phosphomutase